jgi:FixJ family two-component response regulator
MDGSELLKRLASHNTLPPTIVLTAFGNIETAVQTMHQLGASWFLEKPIQPSVLKVLLERAARQSELVEEAERSTWLSGRDISHCKEQIDRTGRATGQVRPEEQPFLSETRTGRP